MKEPNETMRTTMTNATARRESVEQTGSPGVGVWRDTPRGFTLIELIVVVGILASLLMIGATQLGRSSTRAELERASAEVTRMLLRARNFAMVNRRAVVVRINPMDDEALTAGRRLNRAGAITAWAAPTNLCETPADGTDPLLSEFINPANFNNAGMTAARPPLATSGLVCIRPDGRVTTMNGDPYPATSPKPGESPSPFGGTIYFDFARLACSTSGGNCVPQTPVRTLSLGYNGLIEVHQ